MRPVGVARGGGIDGRFVDVGQRAGGVGGPRRRRHRRGGHQRQRPGGGRLGDRRDNRFADTARAHRGHRRPGALRRARPAGGRLRGVRTRLRAARLGARHGAARTDARPAGDGGSRCKLGGPGLPGRVVADDDRAAGGRGGAARVRVDHEAVLRLPPGRQQGDARDPAGDAGTIRLDARPLDAADRRRPLRSRHGDAVPEPRRHAAGARGLDRPDRRGRRAHRAAAPAQRRRAQPGHHAVGLGLRDRRAYRHGGGGHP